MLMHVALQQIKKMSNCAILLCESVIAKPQRLEMLLVSAKLSSYKGGVYGRSSGSLS